MAWRKEGDTWEPEEVEEEEEEEDGLVCLPDGTFTMKVADEASRQRNL